MEGTNKFTEQMSESVLTATLLACVGGFLEAYTFLLHGHVFANAQTGNIALCGISLAMGEWIEAVKYAIPVASFALGVGAVEWIRKRWPDSFLHWRQAIVVLEAFLLCGCFFLSGSAQDRIANLIISVVCAFQVQSFRKVQGTSYASTMCTGNLRSATVAWTTWRRTGLPDAKRQVLHYAGIIAVFLLGAVIAVPMVGMAKEHAVIVPICLLVLTAGVMSFKPQEKRAAEC